MKISHVIGYEVVVPARPGRVNSQEYGPAVFDETPKLIFEVHTEDGLIGLGETLRGANASALQSAIQRLRGVDLTRLCLQEPAIYDLSADDMFAHAHASRVHRYTERTFSDYAEIGIHAAILDLIGKKASLPVSALMGGAYRHRIPVDYWMGRMTPEDSAFVCRDAQSLGYRGVKCKCALEDNNVERALAIVEACGSDFKITFDPNQRFYRFGESIDMLKRLANAGNIGCVEDPFAKHDFESYRLLRAQGLFPVAMHVRGGETLFQAIKMECCDYINLGDLPWNVFRGGGMCWLANIPTWHGSGLDLGVLEALYLHVCAATKSMSRPSDILSRNIREHNLITNPFPVVDGAVELPGGPGLGISLDRDALDRYVRREFKIEMF